jgi:type I restriction-modification system DNA methylase subunit
MSNGNLNWIVNFIWGIADDVLRDIYVRSKFGYEISFTRYFYKPQLLRTLEEIRANIEALQKETEGLLEQILVDTEVY